MSMPFLVVAVFGLILHFYGMTPAMLWAIIGLGLIALKHRNNAGKA